MQITKTLAAAALAISLTASGAQAGVEAQPDGTPGLLIGAIVLGIVGLLLVTGNDGDNGTTSTKNGPDLGIDLPPQGGKVIANF